MPNTGRLEERWHEARWSEAGIAQEKSGAVDRPIKSSELRIFPVKLSASDIVWDRNDFSAVTYKSPRRTLFAEFLRLCSATDERVLGFAERWGVLDARTAIAKFVQQKFLRALPESMSATERQDAVENLLGQYSQSWFDGKVPPAGSAGEPTDVYRGFCQFVRQILTDAVKIQTEDDAYWDQRYPCHNPLEPWGRFRAVESIEWTVSKLVEFSEISFGLAWDIDAENWRTEVHLGTVSPTLATIVIQLMLSVSRADSIYTCTGCGVPYIRSESHFRRPKPNQNNYCPDCGKEQAQLDAKRRYRQKIAEARRLHAAGIPIPRIAEQLDTEVENVEKWVGVEDNGKTKTRKR